MARVYDTYAFSTRVNYAIKCTKQGIITRGFDTCFEMYDSDFVFNAVCRRAMKDDELLSSMQHNMEWSVERINASLDKYKHLDYKALKEAAFDEIVKQIQAMADKFPEHRERCLVEIAKRPE